MHTITKSKFFSDHYLEQKCIILILLYLNTHTQLLNNLLPSLQGTLLFYGIRVHSSSDSTD